MKESIPEIEGDKEKSKHNKYEAKAKRILIDSIKDHLIPHVAKLNTAKEV